MDVSLFDNYPFLIDIPLHSPHGGLYNYEESVICLRSSVPAGRSGHAQTESTTLGDITGIFQDQSKKPIAGATITATRLDDNTTRTATSGADGVYTVHAVPPGRYSVMAQMTGYRNSPFLL